MTEHSDEDLVRQCRAGEIKSFDLLVERHQRTIFNLALRMVRDSDDAADVSQSVFVKAYENLERFDPQFKFFSWLYRIAVNESLNALEQKRRFEGLEGNDLAADTADEKDDEAVREEKRIQDGLMMLNVDQRAVIVLKHMQGLSYREIAQVLDLPEKTVKSRLFSARQLFKDILKKKGVRRNDRRTDS
ncbi:MAG TPA: sigma-70 family RNA polymerase sigma factor [Bacteroidota bacterium]|nr:sigma-70 family RNA polymerase sigma factor [Bacteroidota bacterium]